MEYVEQLIGVTMGEKGVALVNKKEVIKIMRKNLKPKSYILWRKRVKGRITKHRKLLKFKLQA